ncbi:MAG: YhbY family RNA-binding protein [Atopobiaceae bacterium]
MALTGNQIRQLRSMANGLKATVTIGKAGAEAAVPATDSALEANELVKCSVLGNSGLDTREAANALADLTRSEVVQVIGHKFTLYRETSRDDVEKIQLV